MLIKLYIQNIKNWERASDIQELFKSIQTPIVQNILIVKTTLIDEMKYRIFKIMHEKNNLFYFLKAFKVAQHSLQ